MEIVHRRTSVAEIGYRIVFCTKYRRKVLVSNIERDAKQVFAEIANNKGFTIETLETDKDHVHFFVSAAPSMTASWIVKCLKGISARRLFQMHPLLRKRLRRGHLWNPSYYVGTVGNISEDTVRRYIDTQQVRV